ncbi:MAG TPA: DNA repair protein RecO [Gammaproteobacteria bacterium]|nr:DNA repair protein RecO [Gammaproteobacteria bacterium]
MSEREQVLLEGGFVLHQRPYRNTSQLLECVTAAHGRVGLVARGSRRPASRQRALLQPFVPLRLSWIRRGDLGRLTQVEASALPFDLAGLSLLAGYYASELLLRLTARGDPNAEVFSCYSRCLAQLAAHANVARALRLYELDLLRALGYGLELDAEADTGLPLRGDSTYVFELEAGARVVAKTGADDEVYSGRELISLRERELDGDTALRAAQRLLGRALRAHLGDRPLRSRLVLQDIVSRRLVEQ